MVFAISGSRITTRATAQKGGNMEERKQFYSVICRHKVVGISEQYGFEIEIDGEILNAYRNEDKDRAYIIDPQTGLAICTYDYQHDESELPSEYEMIKKARNKLIEDKERFEKWRASRSKESYKLTVEMFAAYKHAEELREKQKEAVLRELNEKRAAGKRENR